MLKVRKSAEGNSKYVTNKFMKKMLKLKMFLGSFQPLKYRRSFPKFYVFCIFIQISLNFLKIDNNNSQIFHFELFFQMIKASPPSSPAINATKFVSSSKNFSRECLMGHSMTSLSGNFQITRIVSTFIPFINF